MAEKYKNADAFFEAYKKLKPEHQDKAEKYVKNMERLEKAEASLAWEEKTLSREMKKKELPAEKSDDEKIRCSFCGKSEDNARRLIVAPSGKVYICDECTAICAEIMEEEFKNYDFEAEEKDVDLEIVQEARKPEENEKK